MGLAYNKRVQMNVTIVLNCINTLQDTLAKLWVAKGISKHKLIIGLPFYGHSYRLANSNDTDVGSDSTKGGVITYVKVCIFFILFFAM